MKMRTNLSLKTRFTFLTLLASCAIIALPSSLMAAEKKEEAKATETQKADERTNKTTEMKTSDVLKSDEAKKESVTLESIARRYNERMGTKGLKQDSIEQAMTSAYDSNPQIKEQRAAVRAADERIVQARAGWRPTINATGSLGYSRTNNSGTTVDSATPGSNSVKKNKRGTESVGVEFQQNIFNGGATTFATQAAEKAIKAARENLKATEQDVLLQAVQAYVDLITKFAELEVLFSNEELLRKTLESTTEKFNVGEETRTSVAQAQGQYAEAIARRQTAEAELEALKATFEKVSGRKPGMLVQPVLPKAMPTSLTQAIDLALHNNPAILKAMYEEEAARRDIDRINGGLLPKVDLIANSSAQKDRTDPIYAAAGPARRTFNDHTVQHSVQLRMSVPLYEAGSTRSQKREATEAAEQRRIAIETQRRAVVEAVIRAWEAFVAAKSNIDYYREQVRANEVSLEGTQQELLVGSKILLDVLNAQSKLLDAQLQLVRAERAMYVAAYQVLSLTGRMTAKGMGLKVELYNPKDHYREVRYKF